MLCRLRLIIITAVVLLAGKRTYSQHTNHEIGFSAAYAGQYPFISSNNEAGFFRKPLVWNLRYQVATNYLQSLAICLEHTGEERSRSGLWAEDPISPQGYNAAINEHFSMTTLGLEGIRTLIRTDEFRLGIGIGLAFGLGGASATVTNISTKETKTFESCDTWSGFFISGFLRGRYTLFINNRVDIGLTGSVRVWGFPSIGPLSQCFNAYNGPLLRNILEVGYLAGISFGWK